MHLGLGLGLGNHHAQSHMLARCSAQVGPWNHSGSQQACRLLKLHLGQRYQRCAEICASSCTGWWFRTACQPLWNQPCCNLSMPCTKARRKRRTRRVIVGHITASTIVHVCTVCCVCFCLTPPLHVTHACTRDVREGVEFSQNHPARKHHPSYCPLRCHGAHESLCACGWVRLPAPCDSSEAVTPHYQTWGGLHVCVWL